VTTSGKAPHRPRGTKGRSYWSRSTGGQSICLRRPPGRDWEQTPVALHALLWLLSTDNPEEDKTECERDCDPLHASKRRRASGDEPTAPAHPQIESIRRHDAIACLRSRPARPATRGAAVIQMLIVEDDPLVADTMQAGLEEHYGAAVIWRGTGFSAVETMKRRQLDIGVIDALLPDMNGFQLARQAANMNIPSLITTGHPDIILLCEHYSFPFLAKPFLPAALVERTVNLIREPEQNIKLVLASCAKLEDAAGSLRNVLRESSRLAEESRRLIEGSRRLADQSRRLVEQSRRPAEESRRLIDESRQLLTGSVRSRERNSGVETHPHLPEDGDKQT